MRTNWYKRNRKNGFAIGIVLNKYTNQFVTASNWHIHIFFGTLSFYFEEWHNS